jgi:hypothetical protein
VADGDACNCGLQNSHQNGGRDFLIFVADPRTVRLCTTVKAGEVGDVLDHGGLGAPGQSVPNRMRSAVATSNVGSNELRLPAD